MIDTIKNGEKLANESGFEFEDVVSNKFEAIGFKLIKYNNWILNEKIKNYIISSYPYCSIYGNNSKSDFLIKTISGFTMRIECKQQMVGGSVDEKFPYLLANAEQAMPEKDILIILNCPGAKQTSVSWLKNQANIITKSGKKNISIKNIEELDSYIEEYVIPNIGM